jgi:hypothetical protein
MASMPEVKAFLIADQVIQEKGTNKWSVIGVFDRVAAKQFPTSRPTLGIYIKLADVQGRLDLALEFRDAQDRILNKLEGIKVETSGPVGTIDLGFQTFNLGIPAAGKYHFVLYINRELAQMVPIEAVALEPGQAPPTPEPPKPV